MVSKTLELPLFFVYLDTAVKQKWIYIWGGQGEPIISMSFGKANSMETSPDNYARVLEHLAKIVREKGFVLQDCRCVDCSGLGCYYFQNIMGLFKYDHNAKAFWKECVEIDPEFRQPGDFVFHSFDSDGPNHIGYLSENDYIVESRGRDYGVIKRKYQQKDWVKIGRPPYWAYPIQRKIKLNMTGPDVGQVQARLKAFGYYKDGKVDNVFGSKTKEAVKLFQKDNGIENNTGNVGEKTTKALMLSWVV